MLPSRISLHGMTQFSVMSGPHEPIRMKINLTTGSARLNGSSEFDEPGLSMDSLNSMEDGGVGVIGKDESPRSVSSSRPESNESAQSSKEGSRPRSSADLADGLLKFTLPTTKSRKRKHVKNTFEVGTEKVDEQTAILRQREQERLAEREKRKIGQDDAVTNVINVSRPPQFDLVEIIEMEPEVCKPSTSKEVKKDDYEVIDISSGEEDNWGGTPRRIAPPANFYFGDLRRRGNVSAAERKQQEEAQAIERRRLKGKKGDSEKDQILNRDGGLLVNPGHSSTEEDIFVAPHLTHTLQPHQLNGVIFMYDNVVVSAEDYKKNKTDGGYGCILAHSMGLGKTLQIITMCDIFFRATKAHKILVLCPINVIQNWYNEFSKWFPAYDERGERLRMFNVHLFGDAIKSFDQRVNLIEEWADKGGVLLMGYEMFRLLNKNIKGQKPKKTRPRIEFVGGKRVDEEKEEKAEKKKKVEEAMTPGGRLTKEANDIISAALIDPGPDLVVCDEGHMIKNVTADISITLSAIKTKRRIILTGYPLQNNLMEYYCMVNFVRPDYLGSKKSFATQFEKPIKNGQCVDSTPHDIKIARQRTHVLIDQLKGFVQRRTQHILKQVLPDSREYVLLMRKSPIQHVLYRSFVSNTMAEMRDGNGSTFNPLKAFAMCSKFWNHPDVLYKCLQELRQLKEDKERKEKQKEMSRMAESAFTPFGGGMGGQMMGYGQTQWMGGTVNGFTPFSAIHNPMLNRFDPQINGGMNGMMGMNGFGGMGEMDFAPLQSQSQSLVDSLSSSTRSSSRVNSSPQKKKRETLASVLADELDLDPSIKYDWADVCMRDYTPGRIDNSPKMKYALSLIDGCTRRGEKIILFSQSLSTLSLMEEALDRVPLETPTGQRMWNKQVNYLRFDGSTNGAEREKLINRFNGDPNIYLFLISTKAGSLGVNLVSASRCIIFDACWNPCHDAQAVCRIYRYGQQQRTFIYRLVMDNSMEKAIFNRQISKNGLQQRVVDEQHVDANVTQKELESLLVYDESLDVIDRAHNVSRWTIEDDILRDVVMRENKLLSQEPFLHESLLLEREEGLSEEEKREALALYQKEKTSNDLGIPLNLETGRSYGREQPNYTNGFPFMNSYGTHNPPPMRSTPFPMTLSSSIANGRGAPIPGGATLGSYHKYNSYQKPPPLMGAPTNPSYLPSSNGTGIGTTKSSILIPKDVVLPVYGRPTEKVFVAKSTPATLFDCGPNNQYISLATGSLLDARGVDLSSAQAPPLSYTAHPSHIPPRNSIPDVIELD